MIFLIKETSQNFDFTYNTIRKAKSIHRKENFFYTIAYFLVI